MRSFIRWIIAACIAILSLDTVLQVIDYAGRWEWLEGQMTAHPIFANLIHGPFFPMLCLAVCLVAVYGERYLKSPEIRGFYLNSRLNHDLSTVTMRDVFDTEERRPGWDEKEIGWHWIIEVRLSNHSDYPVTVEEVEATVKVGGQKWLRKIFPFLRKTIRMKPIKDVSQFQSSPHEDNPGYTQLDGLLQKIKGIPLTRGVGYRGWMAFSCRATQGEMIDHPTLDVFLVDALDVKHTLIYRRDEKSWDKSFDVLKD